MHTVLKVKYFSSARIIAKDSNLPFPLPIPFPELWTLLPVSANKNLHIYFLNVLICYSSLNLTFPYVDFQNPSAFTPNLCSLSDVSAVAYNFVALFFGFFRVKRITSYSLCLLQVVRIHFAKVYLLSIFHLPKFSSHLPSSLLLLVYHFTFVLMKLLEGVKIKCVFNLLCLTGNPINQFGRFLDTSKFNP